MNEWLGRHLKRTGYVVYLSVFVFGFVLTARPEAKGVQLLADIAVAWSVALYCALDWRAHERVFVLRYWTLTIATWPVAPLFLLSRSRGKRGAAHYFKHAALLCVFRVGGALFGVIIGFTGYPHQAVGAQAPTLSE